MKISKLTKRGFDLTLAFLACIILSPVMISIAVLIRLTMGPGIVFRQLRPELHGKPFTIYTSQTMIDRCDENGGVLPDSDRLTSLGKFLRSTLLDELPELLNVLRGDMSLIGPRPLLMQYLDRYTSEQMRRHEVRPGISGWTQVNGRNVITWQERFKLDVWYVDHWSLWLDIKIFFLTLWKILKREGINQPGQATMEEFKGKTL